MIIKIIRSSDGKAIAAETKIRRSSGEKRRPRGRTNRPILELKPVSARADAKFNLILRTELKA